MTENEKKVVEYLGNNVNLDISFIEKLAKGIVESLSLPVLSDCIVIEQEWFESEDSKTGWDNTGWDVPEGYEIDEYIETDKFGHPIKARCKYCR